MLSIEGLDFKKLFEEAMAANSERALAIVLGSIVQDVIADLIAKMLDHPIATLLESDDSFSTFSAIIDLGKAMRLYGEKTRRDLHIVRTIRNKFAHGFGIRIHDKIVPFSFFKSPIQEKCFELKLVDSEELTLTNLTDDRRKNPLQRYKATCTGISKVLVGTTWTVHRLSPVLP